MRNRDDPLAKKTKRADEGLQVSNGWGSWAGEGAPPPPPTKLQK
jgi:hypothetical protein